MSERRHLAPVNAIGEEAVDAPEPFEFEDDTLPNDYRLDRYYTRTNLTQADGSAHNIQAKLPAGIHGEIEALVQSRRIPQYRTAQDVVRDAVVHRLKWVAEQIKAGTLEAAVDTEAMTARIEHVRHQRHQLDRVVRDVEEELKAASTRQDLGAVADVVRMAWDWAENLREPYATEMAQIARQGQETLNRMRR